MIVRKIILEHHCDFAPQSLGEVVAAINKMTESDGPTYIIVEDGNGTYAQAAGSNNRYCVESRDAFGEGFNHWRASTTGETSGGTTKIEYRKRRPKTCTLTVLTGDVLTFDQMSQALLHFASSGERSTACHWRDVTAEFLDEGKEKPIRDIAAER